MFIIIYVDDDDGVVIKTKREEKLRWRVHNETKVGPFRKVDFKMILKVRSDESGISLVSCAPKAPRRRQCISCTRLFRSLLGVESSYKNLFIKSR